ncbi:MAG: hypothetical protein ACHP7H_00500 [Hyphomicrobiales bacterium]
MNETEDHVDQQSASLADRERPQVANHIRPIAVQTLDVLLRIEEILSRAFPAAPQTLATPERTPAVKEQPKPTIGRKNSR